MPVHQPRYTKEEFVQRGDAIYDCDIRPQIEADNKGKFVLIDIETGIWEMDADEMAAAKRLDLRVHDAQVCMVRVGSSYVYRLGIRRAA